MVKTFKVEKRIAAPREKVFAAASDVRRYADVVRGIKKVEVLTEGPIGIGTRFRETRVMFNREATEVMEFVRFDPPSGYSLEAASHGSKYLTTFRFEPDGANATKVFVEFTSEPQSVVAKVFGFVLAPMMKKMIVKCFNDDLGDLAAHLEQESAQQSEVV